MKTFSQYLDEFEEAHGLKNDAKLAEFLDVSRTYVAKCRHGGAASDELCEKIALAVGAHPYAVMLSRDILKGPPKKAALIQDFMARIKVFTLAGIVLTAGSTNNAEAAQVVDLQGIKITGNIILQIAIRLNFACPTPPGRFHP